MMCIRNSEQDKIKQSWLKIAMFVAVLLPLEVYPAQDVEFETSFFSLGSAVDIQQFSRQGYIPSGSYNSRIYVNQDFLINGDVTIKQDAQGQSYSCVPANILSAIPFDPRYVSEALLQAISADNPAPPDSDCLVLTQWLPEAALSYDFSSTSLTITIPQLYLQRSVRGYVPPGLWDAGIPSLSFSYDINGYNDDQQSVNAYLTVGANWGAWYLRHKGKANWSSAENEVDYSTQNLYLSKPIPAINGKLALGYTDTNGRIFDSLSFIGLNVQNDVQMLPLSKRSYAPEIRGVARSNARVTVSQSGRVIYETVVSPGNFLIDDLMPSGFGDQLDVVVYESDGSEQHFVVPFEGVARQLRPGTQRYSVTFGRYQNDSLSIQPDLFEGAYERGLSNMLTGYGGVQGNEDYLAAKAGVSVGTKWGFISLGATVANARFSEGYHGWNYEARYSKNFSEIGNRLSLSANRYSSPDYMSYQDAMWARDRLIRSGYFTRNFQAKERVTFSVTQSLFQGLGQLSFSGVRENSWDSEGYIDNFQLGYANDWRYFSLNINANRYNDANGTTTTNYMANIMVPLRDLYGDDLSLSNLNLSYDVDDNGNDSQRVSATGMAGDDNAFNYTLSAARSNDGDGDYSSSYDTSLSYTTTASRLRGALSHGKDYSKQSVGLNGSVIIHQGGVTLTPETGDTFALIEAKGAEGADVVGHKNVRIDSRGYAAIANLSPYQKNNVVLDPSGASAAVEFDSTLQVAVPYKNAISLLQYHVSKGMPILVYASRNGSNLPFGAVVYDNDNTVIGNVGQGGQLYARVPEPHGSVRVAWGGSEQCIIRYALSDEEQASGRLKIFKASCE